jgi:hypothetical protein
MSISPFASAAAAVILLATGFAASAAQAALLLLDPDVTMTGTVKGSATDKDGKPDAVNDGHAKDYNGATELTAHYTIAFKDGKFDPTGSTVKFTTVYFTWNGKKYPSSWETEEVPITTATLDAGGKVESFDFGANDWYPGADGEGVTNNGIKGTIDLKKKTGTFTTSYKLKSDGSIYKYLTSGVVTGVPEPASWVLMIGGCGLVGLVLRRARRAVLATA